MTPEEPKKLKCKEKWTFETMLAHVMSMLAANDRRYEQRFVDSQTAVAAALAAVKLGGDAQLTATKEAVLKAEAATERRFDSVNEFRNTLADQQRSFIPRAEAELRMSGLAAQIGELKDATLARRGQYGGMRDMWGYVVGAIGVLFGLISALSRFFGP